MANRSEYDEERNILRFKIGCHGWGWLWWFGGGCDKYGWIVVDYGECGECVG